MSMYTVREHHVNTRNEQPYHDYSAKLELYRARCQTPCVPCICIILCNLDVLLMTIAYTYMYVRGQLGV